MDFEILPDGFYSQPKKFSQRDVVLNNRQNVTLTDCCTSGFPNHICFSNPQENTATSTSEPQALPSLASASYPVDINLTTFDTRRIRENRLLPQVLVNHPPQTHLGKSIPYPAHVIQIMEPSVGKGMGRKPQQSGAAQYHPRRRLITSKWIL
ncbi:unnamed protein product [Schistocephalus solidus]|uniref:Uncharacterized protein n=1 Tax=Schistocephalus solidus TaxID=70667 RepID=A0A183TC89_SCHSO|nr:unnamed protein product [Schistocephalus solidus]